MLTTLAPREEKLYICPGETRPITRAVHLSRLAAFFPACRDCPFRNETGHLPRQTVERLQSTERRVERDSLFTTEGVRGVYLNELDRRKAERITTALAGLLWDDAPLMGRTGPDRKGPHRPGPAVVVGHDDRPASPDIVTGVVSALCRMGCQVVDVGLTTKPCFWFAADHLQTAAGVFVTGAGRDPSWTGLDFVGRAALPLSQGTSGETPAQSNRWTDLGRIEGRLRGTYDRPTRCAGTHRTFQAMVPYEAGLKKHFHALRPLRICLATPVRLVRGVLERLFETLPCRVLPVETPCRARDTADPDDPDLRRLGEAVRAANADLGVLIDDDGQRCVVCDERGRLVPAPDVTRLLAADILREHPPGPIVVEPGIEPLLQPVCAARWMPAGAGTLAAMSLAMRERQAVFGGGVSGRYWFREAFPTSDGILTLARILAALSRSDAAVSDLVSKNGRL